MVALFALERLKDRATVHYVAQEIDCTRAEAQRAIEAAQVQFGVEIEKVGPVYRVVSWGALKRTAALGLIAADADAISALTVSFNGL